MRRTHFNSYRKAIAWAKKHGADRCSKGLLYRRGILYGAIAKHEDGQWWACVEEVQY